jgi:uncharacterized protein YbjT (DUF2867 family)
VGADRRTDYHAAMRVLVTGAHGFIGGHVVAALRAAGHDVVALGRGDCDFARDDDPSAWAPRLAGVDAVVNCAGILRERGADTFAAVHERVPHALYRAAVSARVARIVQVSALGDPRDGEFLASKHRGDALLAALDVDWTVLRPSLVYATHGSYGGTSLLRALAALPGVVLAPAGCVQPVAVEDLARAVVAALERDGPRRRVRELGGPQPLAIADYLIAWRRWLGFGAARVVRVPRALARAGAWLGERLGDGPLGTTMERMLERGSVLAPGESDRAVAALGFAPTPLDAALARRPAQTQDRWHARLWLLAPLLRVALATVWIGSGAVGLLLDVETIARLTAPLALGGGAALGVAYGASALDLVLGLLLLQGTAARPVLALMFASTLVYTVVLGVADAALWRDPYGALLKNVALLPALLVAWVLAERR